MTKDEDLLVSKLKPYHIILFSCLLCSVLIINSNHVNEQRAQIKLSKEKTQAYEEMMALRRLEGEKNSDKICKKGSDDLVKYYQFMYYLDAKKISEFFLFKFNYQLEVGSLELAIHGLEIKLKMMESKGSFIQEMDELESEIKKKDPEQIKANPRYKKFREMFHNVVDIHTSGHADKATIKRVIDTIHAKEVVCIHKEADAKL